MNNDSDSPGTGESQYNPRGLPAGGFPPGGLPAGYQIPVPGGYYSFTPVNPSLHDGDNVYRPSLEGISFPVGDAVPEETPNLENETFSLSDLEISPYREDPPAKERGRGRGSRREKGKEAAGSSSQAEGRSKRVNYSVAESVAICRCWIDVSEDAVVSNMQSARGFWHRVAERYDRIRPAGTKAHNADQVRKYFERVKADVVRFMGIYENNLRTQAVARVTKT
ncbi:translation initiation factor IF-2-like [Salvia divinorum]|uniref:Translation initiation factor IF-2-like n=1 Tax=Salvia divinorum TaxID=28513 RepID=A0ABD1IH82_SALDI